MERWSDPREDFYIVSRNTDSIDWDLDIKPQPCKKAFQVEVKLVDKRNVNNPTKLNDKYDADTWFDYGQNHRLEKNMICRDVGWQVVWLVYIANLMDFIDEYGDCIVSRNHNGFGEIEIYDAYR